MWRITAPPCRPVAPVTSAILSALDMAQVSHFRAGAGRVAAKPARHTAPPFLARMSCSGMDVVLASSGPIGTITRVVRGRASGCTREGPRGAPAKRVYSDARSRNQVQNENLRGANSGISQRPSCTYKYNKGGLCKCKPSSQEAQKQDCASFERLPTCFTNKGLTLPAPIKLLKLRERG